MGDAELMKTNIQHKKGQSALEVGMAITLTFLIVMATVRLWYWAVSSMNVRFDAYQGSRESAVRSIDEGCFGQWIDPGNRPLTLVP